jgi:hypothetical protein
VDLGEENHLRPRSEGKAIVETGPLPVRFPEVEDHAEYSSTVIFDPISAPEDEVRAVTSHDELAAQALDRLGRNVEEETVVIDGLEQGRAFCDHASFGVGSERSPRQRHDGLLRATREGEDDDRQEKPTVDSRVRDSRVDTPPGARGAMATDVVAVQFGLS